MSDMQTHGLDFVADDTLAEFRLQRLEIFNWGTFDFNVCIEGTLVDGAVAEKAHGDFRQLAQHNAVANTCCDGKGFTDNRIAAHETAISVEQEIPSRRPNSSAMT